MIGCEFGPFNFSSINVETDNAVYKNIHFMGFLCVCVCGGGGTLIRNTYFLLDANVLNIEKSFESALVGQC